MRPARIVLPLAAALMVAADAQAQGRMGSIYNPDHGPLSLPADKTARRVGDLLTIVISETQNVRNEEKTDLSKESSLSYQLLDLAVAPNAFDPLPSIATAKMDDFVGDAKVEKKRTFTARLTAIVMDTLPNGNLVVQGRREIRIDAETKVIEFSGIVRRYDVRRDNTVQSELVADARVAFSGSGPITNTTRRYGVPRTSTARSRPPRPCTSASSRAEAAAKSASSAAMSRRWNHLVSAVSRLPKLSLNELRMAEVQRRRHHLYMDHSSPPLHSRIQG